MSTADVRLDPGLPNADSRPDARLPSAEPRLDPRVPIVVYIETWIKGGAADYAADLACELRRQGYRVVAICHPHEALADLRAQLRDADVNVRTIPGSGGRLSVWLQRLRLFASVVRQERGCILALLMGYFDGGAIISVVGALAGAGAIVRADLQPPMPPLTWRDRALVRLKDRIVDRIVVGALENRAAYVRLMGRSPRKIDVVHTGIDLVSAQAHGRRDATRHGFDLEPEHLVVGVVSRLSEDRKGIRYFLEMAADVGRAEPLARFLIVGDGHLRSRFEAQATQLGISDRVRFVGWRSDLANVLSSMDVFVMPSLHEGGPMSLLKAMAAGLPIVATRVGMVPEIIEDGRTGLIVEPADSQALTRAVRRLLSDPQLRARTADRARAHVEHHLTLRAMASRYLQVFARARAQRTRGSRGLVSDGLATLVVDGAP